VFAFVIDGRLWPVARDHARLAGKDVQFGANGGRKVGERSARQIGAANGFGEEGIAREQDRGVTAKVVADRAPCVPRGVQNLNGQLANRNGFPAHQPLGGGRRARSAKPKHDALAGQVFVERPIILVNQNGRACGRGDLAGRENMIEMSVGVKYVRDRHPHVLDDLEDAFGVAPGSMIAAWPVSAQATMAQLQATGPTTSVRIFMGAIFGQSIALAAREHREAGGHRARKEEGSGSLSEPLLCALFPLCALYSFLPYEQPDVVPQFVHL